MGILSANKAPKLKTLHQFLTKHGIPESKREGLNMAIRTDQGGELAGSEEFNKIANSHGYSIERTAAGSLSQNGIAERPNETIGNTLRAMLMGAGIEDKYWSEALLHAIYIKNRLPHSAFKLKSTPYTKMTGKRPNLEKTTNFWMPGNCTQTGT